VNQIKNVDAIVEMKPIHLTMWITAAAIFSIALLRVPAKTLCRLKRMQRWTVERANV
jgi:hypothetical protein